MTPLGRVLGYALGIILIIGAMALAGAIETL